MFPTMFLHGLPHEIYLMTYRAFHSDTKTLVETILLLLVCLLFLVVGISRWVEFLDFGFSKLRRNILIVIHWVGCTVLAFAFAIEAIDLDKKYSSVGMGFLASALVLLFPIHIYIGLLRRIRNRQKSA